MKKLFMPVSNQNGSMIFIALMLLVILTIMGITATNTSIIENRMAVNEQLHKMALNHADLGVYSTAKIIGFTVDEGDMLTDPDFGFDYASRYENGEDFYEHITGLVGYDDGEWDVRYVLVNDACTGTGCVVRADIEFIGTDITGDAMGGAVFGEGSTLPIGGQEISVFFRITSEGTSPRNSIALLSAGYQKVLGVPGGL